MYEVFAAQSLYYKHIILVTSPELFKTYGLCGAVYKSSFKTIAVLLFTPQAYLLVSAG